METQEFPEMDQQTGEQKSAEETLPSRSPSTSTQVQDGDKTAHLDRNVLRIDAAAEDVTGEWLRHVREVRGFSEEYIESRTRIRPRMLRAIEEGDRSFLPEPVYIRGFLKQLSKVLSVEPDIVVEGYFRFLETDSSEVKA